MAQKNDVSFAVDALVVFDFAEADDAGLRRRAVRDFVCAEPVVARRWPRVEATRAGSETYKVCPGVRVVPLRWFQLRSSSTDTLNRSATVTSVSPFLAV